VLDKSPDVVPYLMSDEEEPVPEAHVIITEVLPGIAETAVGADGEVVIGAQLSVVKVLSPKTVSTPPEDVDRTL
jgi:hypothetical protein